MPARCASGGRSAGTGAGVSAAPVHASWIQRLATVCRGSAAHTSSGACGAAGGASSLTRGAFGAAPGAEGADGAEGAEGAEGTASGARGRSLSTTSTQPEAGLMRTCVGVARQLLAKQRTSMRGWPWASAKQ